MQTVEYTPGLVYREDESEVEDDVEYEIRFIVKSVDCPFCQEESRGLVPKNGHGSCEHCGLTLKEAVKASQMGLRV